MKSLYNNCTAAGDDYRNVISGCSFTNQKEQTRIIVDITGAEVEISAEVDEVVNLFSFGCQLMVGL